MVGTNLAEATQPAVLFSDRDPWHVSMHVAHGGVEVLYTYTIYVLIQGSTKKGITEATSVLHADILTAAYAIL
jgi:hypothetical protein